MTPQVKQRIARRVVVPGLAGLSWLLTGCATAPPVTQGDERLSARLQLGMMYLARDDLAAAQRNLESALALAPDDYRTQLGMALYEQRIGEYQAAEQRYQSALRQTPENGSVMNNYGAFLCSLGQYVPAQKQFSAAAQLPDYRQVAQALENAGYCYFKARQNDKARSFLDRALNIDPAKGTRLLAEVEHQLVTKNVNDARQLLDIYHHRLPASAESLWLEIRFAALVGSNHEVNAHGDKLARSFPQSKQYQQFLANEY